MKNPTSSLAAWRGPAAALGLLLFRLHLGVVMVESGLPKLEPSDWFTSQVANLGFTWPSPEMWAWLAAWGEFAGGIMLILGLGTRLAAVQLSFQFFVISFWWYDKPEFFTGVYVQQELFWGFVMLLATGAGSWSADAWLRGRTWRPMGRQASIGTATAGVAALLLLAMPLMACSSLGLSGLRSQVSIEVGKQFELGGTQLLGFRVAAHNVGPVAVEIKEVTSGGQVVSVGVLPPGQQTKAVFGMGSRAVIVNLGQREAKIDVDISNAAGLSMGYSAAQASVLPAASGPVPVGTTAGTLPSDLRSDLTIEPGKQFSLGGGQRGPFKVVAKNKGTVSVDIKEQLSGGGLISKATLRPGQGGALRFAAGSAAVLLNPSAAIARLDLTVTGDFGNLRMATEQLPKTGKTAAPPRLTGAELSDALADWHGTLTYRNYGTQETVKLNTALRGEMSRPDQLLLRFDYEEPNKTHVFGTDTLYVAPDGTRVRWDNIDYAVRSKVWLPGQVLNVVLEGAGQDGRRAATIRKTIVLSPRQFLVKKEVRYAANTAFLERNHYQFTR
ncbi:DoxX family protein [Hymenobacter sp. IS2118]|uniref:DoxX family protein n=1 Tax=Hymenobacter sp. IS2118 TaxID=1505605 RepID=UPI00068CD46D|nr:DoxX family protein [Hymenobacter sp. IS2118]